jgi:uncharacterized FlgJ-related protein
MIYYYDQNELVYRNVTKKAVLTIIGITFITSLLFVSIFLLRINKVEYISEETKAIIIRESIKDNEFSPERLRGYLDELNVRFPHIVYAQARLESGNFKSSIFRNNNNLFGMKVARRRPTTNKGEENGHAYYDNWKESVQDYAFFQAAYLNDVKTEGEYFQYLSANYASSENYVNTLKGIINKEKQKNNLLVSN